MSNAERRASLNMMDVSKHNLNSSTIMYRLLLYKHEVYRLPEKCQGVRVLAGVAWLTLGGQDIFLRRGEKKFFTVHGDFALVSALGNTPLVLEVLGNNCQHFHMALASSP